MGPSQLNILVGNPAVNEEFSQKIRELDRRLQANGMSYRDWDTLNDRQHEIFSHDMFLDGECAANPEQYVKGAVESCGCPDTAEELHHHSPVLMREIEKQQEMLPDITVRIGEGLSNLNETIDNILELMLVEAKGTPEEQAFKRFLNKLFKDNNINTGSSGRTIYHFRAFTPIPGSADIDELKSWFSKFDIDVEEKIPSISGGGYYTFILRARKDIPAQFQKNEYDVSGAKDIPAGSEIPYVVLGVVDDAAAPGEKPKKKLINKKEINPAGLGLASDSKQWESASEIVDATVAALNGTRSSPYPKSPKPEWVAPELAALLGPAQDQGNLISLKTPLSFGAKDLAQISQDYGEILAAIWGMSQSPDQNFSFPYDKVIFPADPATKLLDFFAIAEDGTRIPVSVKSGTTGGKVTIKNITETAKLLYEMSKGTEGGIASYRQFMAVEKTIDEAPNNKVQPLYVHKVLRSNPETPNSPVGTRTIRLLAEIMSKNGAPGAKWEDLGAKTVLEWLKSKTNEELLGDRMPALQDVKNKKGKMVKAYVDPKVQGGEGTGILEPFWVEANSWPKLSSYIQKGGQDRNWLVMSPMGSQMIKLLNADQAIQDELNRLARTLTVVQANVNAKQKTLSFQVNKFKEAAFVFDWPGYVSGNTLGFRMELNK